MACIPVIKTVYLTDAMYRPCADRVRWQSLDLKSNKFIYIYIYIYLDIYLDISRYISRYLDLDIPRSRYT